MHALTSSTTTRDIYAAANHELREMAPREKAGRRLAVAKFFTCLRVKADAEQIGAYSDATALIPAVLLREALARAVQSKSDGYQTAPQPGEIWELARRLIPSDQWEYSSVSGSAPPKWFRDRQRAQVHIQATWAHPDRLEGGRPSRELAASLDGYARLIEGTE